MQLLPEPVRRLAAWCAVILLAAGVVGADGASLEDLADDALDLLAGSGGPPPPAL